MNLSFFFNTERTRDDLNISHTTPIYPLSNSTINTHTHTHEQGVLDILPAYASVLLKYDPLKCTYSELIPHVTTALSTASSTSHSKSTFSNNTVEIPVNYDGEDLESAAHHANLSSSSDVALAPQNGTYRVYFLGFTGGFPYLGGLPSSLASVPRLDTPRQIVPKGSVGIAAGQTGVYTLDTPGGWHLIGRTPMSLFDATKDPPSVLKAGDIVKFVPTSTDSTTSSSSSSKTIQHEPTNPIIEILKPGPLTAAASAAFAALAASTLDP